MMLPTTMSSCGSGPEHPGEQHDDGAGEQGDPLRRAAGRSCAAPTPITTNDTTTMHRRDWRQRPPDPFVEEAEHDLGDQHDGA